MPNTRKNPRDPDSPFVTREGMQKAVPFSERFPKMDMASVTVVCTPEDKAQDGPSRGMKKTSIPLAIDLVTELRATGPEWPDLAEKILRAGLRKLKQKAA